MESSIILQTQYLRGENTSSTYYDNSYAMMNTKDATTVKYFVAAGARSVLYSSTTTTDVYDQAALAGIIAKGAVTPYEQKFDNFIGWGCNLCRE